MISPASGWWFSKSTNGSSRGSPCTVKARDSTMPTCGPNKCTDLVNQCAMGLGVKRLHLSSLKLQTVSLTAQSHSALRGGRLKQPPNSSPSLPRNAFVEVSLRYPQAYVGKRSDFKQDSAKSGSFRSSIPHQSMASNAARSVACSFLPASAAKLSCVGTPQQLFNGSMITCTTICKIDRPALQPQ